MNWLGSAPKSPQQRPNSPENYFYATKNNHNSMANPYAYDASSRPNLMQSQQPQTVRAPYGGTTLQEDVTVESLSNPSKKNGGQKFVGILIIGIVSIGLLVGGGIGAYMLLKEKPKTSSNETTDDARSDLISSEDDASGDVSGESSDGSTDDGSYDSAENNNVPQRNIIPKGDIKVHGILLQDITGPDNNAYLMYNTPSNTLSYSDLVPFTQDRLFETKEAWTSEKENNPSNKLNNACDYFKANLKERLQDIPSANKVHLCNGKYDISQHNDNPLLYTITESSPTIGHNYYMEMKLMAFTFTCDQKLYALGSADLEHLVKLQKNDEPSASSSLPPMKLILEQNNLWIPLQNTPTTASELRSKIKEHQVRDGTHTTTSRDLSENGVEVGTGDFLLFKPEYPDPDPNVEFDKCEMKQFDSDDCQEFLKRLIFTHMQFKLVRETEQGNDVYECNYNPNPVNGQTNLPVEVNSMWWLEMTNDKLCQDKTNQVIPPPINAYPYRADPVLISVSDIIRRWGEPSNNARRLQGEECHCLLDYDGNEWKIKPREEEMELMRCSMNVYAKGFQSGVKLKPQHIFTQIEVNWARDLQGVPLARFKLPDDGYGKSPQDTAQTPPDAGKPPDATATLPYRRRRRNLITEDENYDASRAENTDNFYIIIGSTIFCLIIGIQSFYCLSYS